MSHENPGAYREAQNKINDLKEREKIILEVRTESFEKGKEKIRSKKKLDIFELRRRFETGRSLDLLKDEMQEALRGGDISVDLYNQSMQVIEHAEKSIPLDDVAFHVDRLPFSQNPLAQYFEKKPIGENIFTDIVGFLYGSGIQGSTILIILLWKIIVDTFLLPKDIYTTYIQR